MTLHYDYQVRWKNFRGFRDTGLVRIAPLTIVIGANNSGKSSLLAPFILMQQTLQSKDPTTPLVTRGSYTDIGFYKDYTFLHDTEKNIDFLFYFHTHIKPKGERLKPIGTYPPGVFCSTFTHGHGGKDLNLYRYEVLDIYRRKMFELTRGSNGFDIDASRLGELSSEERRAISQSRPVNFLFSSSSALYQLQNKANRSEDEAFTFENLSEAFDKYLQIASYAYEDIRRQLSNWYYIGPHREQPKRAYDYFGDEPGSVGKEGEHFAELLKNNKGGILNTVNKWIKKLGIGKSIEIEDLSANLFSLYLVSSSGADRNNIADLGFGVSQVLPVLVQLLAARPGSFTIVEQPELHLNPKLQRNIADILVDRAANGRRVAIETHSEHILLRIRTLVAERRIQPEDIALYFVERQGAKSSVRKVEIDAFGHIKPEEWPKEFFSEKFNGAMELASAQREAKRSQ
jgi:predicted ATPase